MGGAEGGGARYGSEMPGPHLLSRPATPGGDSRGDYVELRVSLCPFRTQSLENLFPCTVPAVQNQLLQL